MKKIYALLILIITVTALAACKSSDAPDGMQTVMGGDNIGYYFYAPEEWTVANLGEIATTYASSVDKTSATYIETEPPIGTVQEYFTESLKEFPNAPSIIVYGETTTFGNSDEAIEYVYDYIYDGKTYRTKQIFVSFEGRFGIFTFTAVRIDGSEEESVSDTDKYEFYKEKLQLIIDNFKFVSKTDSGNTDSHEYEKDADGYNLVSDAKISKFSLYLPESFKVNFSSGMVSASLEDGSNITMSRAVNTSYGETVGDYFEDRIKELEKIVSNFKAIEFSDEDGEIKTIKEDAVFGNAIRAASMEYTFVYNNEAYHVYQVCAITNSNAFVFTYTAKEDNYQKHLEIINKVCEKAELK